MLFFPLLWNSWWRTGLMLPPGKSSYCSGIPVAFLTVQGCSFGKTSSVNMGDIKTGINSYKQDYKHKWRDCYIIMKLMKMRDQWQTSVWFVTMQIWTLTLRALWNLISAAAMKIAICPFFIFFLKRKSFFKLHCRNFPPLPHDPCRN